MRVMVDGKMLSGEGALRHLLTQERHRAERAESDVKFWRLSAYVLSFVVGCQIMALW